eukprot:TRINITY_DN33184_c0_g1_i1.p1 TRINITY_DN33184_c0_g1~~TRINITY_DN33184_c0_g1_i1.p1  ORF type:complete len:527 (+),score=154.05 TRINITY_DN33184_c0_g1_i1:72-1652(+)
MPKKQRQCERVLSSHSVVPGTAATRIPAFVLAVPIFFFGVLVLVSSPLVLVVAGSAAWIRSVVYWISAYVVVKPLRWFLDTVCTYLYWIWWLPSLSHIAQDGRPVLEGCAIGELQYYGGSSREWLQAIHPTRVVVEQRPEAEPVGSSPGSPSLQVCAERGLGAAQILESLGVRVSRKVGKALSSEGVLAAEDLMRCTAADLDAVGFNIGSRNKVLSWARCQTQRCWACGAGLSATAHVVYAHGGGFIAANATLLMSSMMPVARAGYTVWCVNYPLAPDNKFPAAVLSILQALQFLRSEHNVTRVSIVGDSAGGGLVCTAAALLRNPELMQELAATLPPDLSHLTPHTWVYPDILGVCSMYGVLDTCSWLRPDVDSPSGSFASPPSAKSVRSVAQLSALENNLSAFALDFMFWCYNDSGKVLQGRRTVCDLLPYCSDYPPTLLICGTVDILMHSSKRAFRELKEKGFPVKFHWYRARHAFVGLPPQLRWIRYPLSSSKRNGYVRHAKPATEEVIAWLRNPAEYCAAP